MGRRNALPVECLDGREVFARVRLSELTPIAMLGTERQNLSTPKGGGALGELLAQLDLNQREPSLLAASALSAMHERVGALPARDSAPLTGPCASETFTTIDVRAGSLLRRLVDGEHAQLL